MTTTTTATGAATMSEARRYQQLRAHLSYLKLNDAADALPRVLDAARTDRPPTTLGTTQSHSTTHPAGRRLTP